MNCSMEDRFFRKVTKGEGCWLWTGCRNSKGYGTFWNGEKVTGAHRVSWAMTNGPIPESLHVLHHCDISGCVNPEHLYLGTNSDNVRDKMLRNPPRPTRGNRKLTDQQVYDIYALRRLENVTTIAKRFGVCKQVVYNILSGTGWSGVTHAIKRPLMKKLLAADILQIKSFLGAGVPQVKIAKMYGVVPGHISNIATGRAWTAK